MAIMTGLSGNEMYCLKLKGLDPGSLVVGNSVFSMGFFGGVGSGIRMMMGGEVTQVTSIIHEGRQKALERMQQEAIRHGGIGITGVTNELIQHSGNIEFLSIGSCVHQAGVTQEHLSFSTSADGQELYCQMDAGFRPMKFVFGNVAYSIGIGGGIMGGLRSMKRGEVHEYSEVFNTTRHLALQRVVADARSVGANSVVGIQTTILPFSGMQEMLMTGTASHHPALNAPSNEIITSDLTNEEMWNIINMGYMPVRLVLGVSVYSLGIVGGITSAFKALGRGEIAELTSLIYEARANALDHIAKEAAACGADDVMGIKTYVYQLGSGMIEFMAIGTAVKKMEGIRTLTEQLPPQAIIRDKDTYINTAELVLGTNLNPKTDG